MKRYIVFKGFDYYPVGGWEDFIGDFDTVSAASAAIGKLDSYEWAHIVDTRTMAFVEETEIVA